MSVATEVSFKVDPEFKHLIPPLSADELAQLEANLIADGCRDPLVVWKEDQKLVDGHNRFDICKKRGIDFRIKERSFATREDAMIWIIDNQRGRRNLPAFSRGELELRRKDLVADKARKNLKTSTGGVNPQPLTTLSKADHINTRAEIAKAAKVSEGTLAKIETISRKAPEWIKQDLRDGKKTINAVHREIKKVERVEAIKKQAAAEEKAAPKEDVLKKLEDGAGQFRCVYLDPPWKYDDETSQGAAASQYPTMSPEKLAELPVGELAHKEGAHFWIWTTWPKIRDRVIHQVVDAWGLDWVGEIVWNKMRIGPGRYLRSQTEVLVLAVKKKAPLLAVDQGNYMEAERSSRHSEKPEPFYTVIERLSPGPRIELFARKARQGWKRWGIEA